MFFPDQNAWDKLAKALKTEADEDVFAAFNVSGFHAASFPPRRQRGQWPPGGGHYTGGAHGKGRGETQAA